MSRKDKSNAVEKSPWLAPLQHVRKYRLKEFAVGKLELEEIEHAHIIVCHRCSHLIADWVLTRIESEGDHAGIRRIWDLIFHRR